MTAPGALKHRRVYTALRGEIMSGRWKPGDRLPSEAQLVKRFRVSRITVTRAIRDLQHAGLVDRRAGSGTFARTDHALSFGLLIPELGSTDIFEPMCEGMMASPLAHRHALLWGGAMSADRAWATCRDYIDRKVAGVFFAPLETADAGDDINARIVDALDAARIPVVLLDRPFLPYPETGRHDLVGIDNRRAGYVITHHLLQLGCRRVAFVGPGRAAATVDTREAGYREALFLAGIPFDAALVQRFDADGVRAWVTGQRPDGIVCANDRTAAALMSTVLPLGIRIPHDLRLVGIDDVEYARLLPVPLTTLRQPTAAMGHIALSVMLDRLRQRDLPPRQVLLHAELIVRDSCGARG